MSSPFTSSSFGRDGAYSNRSLASAHENSLAPPSLMDSSSSVLRSLYPGAASAVGSSSSSNHAAFALEPTIYRSVALMAEPAQAFDPLHSYDQHNAYGAYNNGGGDLSMPKLMQQADFRPTLKHSPQPFFAEVNKKTTTQNNLEVPTAIPAPAAVAETATVIAPLPSSATPPQVPEWLEPNSHFFCSCAPPTTPTLLYDTVHSTLQSLHESPSPSPEEPQPQSDALFALDCTLAPARFKIECFAYQLRCGDCTPFVVRVFTVDAAKHKYCVEFQRRKGDVAAFWTLFRLARSRIQAAHPCSDAANVAAPELPTNNTPLNLRTLDVDAGLAPPSCLRSWSAPPLPVEAGGPSFSRTQICETVRSLLQMVASPCVDIKLQGTLALAELTRSPSFDAAVQHCDLNVHSVLMAEGCLPAFLGCLQLQGDLDLLRASLTALANLSETQEQLCAQVMEDEKSLSCLYQLAGSPTQHVARECARFLANCASKLGARLMERLPVSHKPNFAQAVSHLMQHTDKHCRKHASLVQTCIDGATVGAQ